MNNTKRALIITAIVLNFFSIALNIYFIVAYFMTVKDFRGPLFYTILDIFQILVYIACTGMLIYSILGKGQYFRQRYGFYMTAVVMSMIINLISVATILLIISLFTSDIVWVKPEKENKNTIIVEPEKEENFSQKSKEKKVAQLRKLREEGKISEEEFNDELMKLL